MPRSQVDARSAVLAIVSNHPASFTISGHWSGDATTSQRLRQRYAVDRDRGDVHNVVTCAVLTPANERGEIRIAGVDDFASSASRTVVIDARPFDHKRPPISVTPTGDMIQSPPVGPTAAGSWQYPHRRPDAHARLARRRWGG